MVLESDLGKNDGAQAPNRRGIRGRAWEVLGHVGGQIMGR